MISDYEIFATMERYGGSFAKAIAAAARRADAENFARLKAAFPELIEEYRQMAQLIAAERDRIA